MARGVLRERPVYALHAFGDTDDVPLMSVEAFADCYLRLIREVQPFGPYCVVGWSVGGLIAYALACMLRELRQDVALLAIVDAVPATVTTVGNKEWMNARAKKVDIIEVAKNEIYDAPATMFSDNDKRRILKMMDHSSDIAQRFVPSSRFDGDALFVASQGSASEWKTWSSLITGTISVVELQCSHSALGKLDKLGRIVEEYLSVSLANDRCALGLAARG